MVSRSFWNYRVFLDDVYYSDDGGSHDAERIESLSVREVYYDEIQGEEKITGWTKDPINLAGFDSKEDLIQTLEMILRDAKKDKPVLRELPKFKLPKER